MYSDSRAVALCSFTFGHFQLVLLAEEFDDFVMSSTCTVGCLVRPQAPF